MVLVVEGAIDWGYGLPMALGGLIGGYLGGTLSGRVNRTALRAVVMAIGFGLAAYYFWTPLRSTRAKLRRRISPTDF